MTKMIEFFSNNLYNLSLQYIQLDITDIVWQLPLEIQIGYGMRQNS